MKIHQIQQISEAHCGPAVLEMLLETVGVEVTQDMIVETLGIEDMIDEQGVRPDQLGTACVRLAPQIKFWYKYHADLDDVLAVLERGYAVGVEWQGLFYKSEDIERKESSDEGDYGHYSIISYYDKENQQLIIVDPYKDFANQDRIFDVPVFLRRWWDTNEIMDPETGRMRIETDERLIFFITPQDESFPEEFGFTSFSTE